MEMSGDDRQLKVCREVASSWAPVLRALGHSDRLLIVLWLANTACSVRELEAVTGLAQSSVSYHLGELRRVGMVEAVAEGRTNRYRLVDPDLDGLASFIGSLCVIDGGENSGEPTRRTGTWPDSATQRT